MSTVLPPPSVPEPDPGSIKLAHAEPIAPPAQLVETQATVVNAAYDPLADYLLKYDCMEALEVFQREGMRINDVKSLTDDDLKELGLPMGPRKRLRLARADADGDGNVTEAELAAFEAKEAALAAAKQPVPAPVVAQPAATAPAPPDATMQVMMMKMEMEKQERLERQERQERLERQERAERQERQERADRAAAQERADRLALNASSERSAAATTQAVQSQHGISTQAVQSQHGLSVQAIAGAVQAIGMLQQQTSKAKAPQTTARAFSGMRSNFDRRLALMGIDKSAELSFFLKNFFADLADSGVDLATAEAAVRGGGISSVDALFDTDFGELETLLAPVPQAEKILTMLRAAQKAPTVTIRVRSARGLKKMDFFGKADPYVVLSLGSQTVKTKTIRKNLNPIWNETFQLSLATTMEDSLIATVYDWDQASRDDPMGRVVIPLASICKLPQYRWHLGCILLKMPAISLRTGGAEDYGRPLQNMGGCTAAEGTLAVNCNIGYSAVDIWRQQLFEEQSASWLADHDLTMQVLKPPASDHSQVAWKNRQIMLTGGMFIWTTFGVLESVPANLDGFGTVDSVQLPTPSAEGWQEGKRKYQLRGRARISKNATVEDIAVAPNERTPDQTAAAGTGAWGNSVFGLRFRPSPDRLNLQENPSKEFALYCATAADRDYLREAIKLSIRYVQRNGVSTESENYPGALRSLVLSKTLPHSASSRPFQTSEGNPVQPGTTCARWVFATLPSDRSAGKDGQAPWGLRCCLST